MSNVGRIIHLTRTVKGTTIGQLAARIGRSEGHLTRIEEGLLSGTPATLCRLATELDISVTVLRDAYLQDAVETAMAVWKHGTNCQQNVTSIERKGAPKVVQ